MTTITKIYDTSTIANDINFTNTFTNCDFLLLETPDLQESEGYIIGVSLILNVPGLAASEIPLNLEAGDTKLLIRIPQEFSYQKFSQQLLIATTEKIRLKIFAISLNCTLPDIKERTDKISEKIEDLDRQIKEIKLQLDVIENLIKVGIINNGNSGNPGGDPPVSIPPQTTNNPLLGGN